MINLAAIPEKYKCSISCLIMRDTVIASDGHHYENEFILRHLVANNKSPITREALQTNLFPDVSLRSEINEYLENNQQLFENNEVYLPHRLWLELETAIAQNNTNKFNKLIKYDPRLLYLSAFQAQEQGITLHSERLEDNTAEKLAIQYRSLEILNEIRTHQKLPPLPSLPESSEYQLNSDLLEAVKSADLDSVKKLIDQGANINAFGGCDGNSTLHEAVLIGSTVILEYLLMNGAVMKANLLGTYPIHQAAACNNPAIIEILLKYNVDINTLDAYKNTALHRAVFTNAREAIVYLLEKGIEVDHINKHGYTALHYAVKKYIPSGRDNERNDIVNHCLSIVKFLVDAGANASAMDSSRRNLLHKAYEPEIIEYLLQLGISVNVLDNSRQSPLSDPDDYEVNDEQRYNRTKALLDNTRLSDISVLLRPPQAGINPFLQAIRFRDLKTIKLYMQKFSNLNQIDASTYIRYSLPVALLKATPEIISELLSNPRITVPESAKEEAINTLNRRQDLSEELRSQLLNRINRRGDMPEADDEQGYNTQYDGRF